MAGGASGDTNGSRLGLSAAGGVPVSFSKDEVESLTGSGRVALSGVTSASFGVLVPEIFAEYVHEFENDSRTITTSAGDVFTTEDPDRDWFTLGADVSAVLPGGWSGFVNLEGDVARSDQDRLRIEIGLRKKL